MMRLTSKGRWAQKWPDWVLEHVPEPLVLHPIEIFLGVMCLLSGSSLVVTRTPPSSVQGLLPEWLVIAWGSQLTIGGLLLVVGLSLQTQSGGILERAGLMLLSGASAAYSLSLLTIVGVPGIFPAAITMGFGGACGMRLLTLVWAEKVRTVINEVADSLLEDDDR